MAEIFLKIVSIDEGLMRAVVFLNSINNRHCIESFSDGVYG
jgi:hypothetical protein